VCVMIYFGKLKMFAVNFSGEIMQKKKPQSEALVKIFLSEGIIRSEAIVSVPYNARAVKINQF
jgi:hypothetical protein